MKHVRLVIVCALLCSVTGSASEQVLTRAATADFPLALNLTVNNNIATTSALYDTSSQSTVANAHAAMKDITLVQKAADNSAALMAYLAFLGERSLEKQKNIFSALYACIMRNKWKSLAVACITFYGSLSFLLKKYEYGLSDHLSWSRWRSDKKLSELYLLTEEELVRDLLESIQDRYSVLDKLDDFATPLSCFMHDSERELSFLKRYAHCVQFLNRVRLARWFSINYDLLNEIALRKERLNYLKGKLWTFISKHKVKQWC